MKRISNYERFLQANTASESGFVILRFCPNSELQGRERDETKEATENTMTVTEDIEVSYLCGISDFAITGNRSAR